MKIQLLAFLASAVVVSSDSRVRIIDNDANVPAQCQGFFQYDDISTQTNLFTESSTYQLTQTGVYKGEQDILEYILFAFSSPFIGEQLDYFTFTKFLKFGPDDTLSQANDGKEYCQFFSGSNVHATYSELSTVPNLTHENALFHKIFWDPTEEKIAHMILFREEDGVLNFFQINDTPASGEFICSTLLSDRCSETAAKDPDLSTVENCVTRFFDDIPLFNDGGQADGNSRACRYVHGYLASFNAVHCPHISLVPVEDVNGVIKCQTSAHVSPTDVLTDYDFAVYDEFLKLTGFVPGVSHRYVGNSLTGVQCERGYYLEDPENDTECKNICSSEPGTELDAELGICVDCATEGRQLDTVINIDLPQCKEPGQESSVDFGGASSRQVVSMFLLTVLLMVFGTA